MYVCKINMITCRSFLENKDGTYSFHISQETEKDQYRSLPGKKIKAYELKTFLKVFINLERPIIKELSIPSPSVPLNPQAFQSCLA